MLDTLHLYIVFETHFAVLADDSPEVGRCSRIVLDADGRGGHLAEMLCDRLSRAKL